MELSLLQFYTQKGTVAEGWQAQGLIVDQAPAFQNDMIAGVIGVCACFGLFLTWHYGTLSVVSILSAFILLNLGFSLNMGNTFASQGLELTSILVLYIYGGAIVMLFLLAAVSIPRSKLVGHNGTGAGDAQTNKILGLLSWPSTLIFLLPVYFDVSEVRTSVQLNSMVASSPCSGLGQVEADTPLRDVGHAEFVRIAEGMTAEPLLYIQACGLLILGLIVVLEVTTEPTVPASTKHANSKGVVAKRRCF